MIKIGVSPGMLYKDASRTSFAPKRLQFIVEDMARYLRRKEVMPILIPSLESTSLRAFVKEMDGIVMQGGDDVAPETYGEKSIGRWSGDVQRDVIELEILKYASMAEKPIYGICRGFQLMNVFFGGTLYQDLDEQFSSDIKHKTMDYDQNVHEIHLKKGSYLHGINNKFGQVMVNSIHHQAVKELSPVLEPIAWSGKNLLVEAFVHKSSPHIIGVQWHPEYDWNHSVQLLSAEKIYNYFLKFCKR
jgi:putative glutamine amidotransferase